MEYQNRRYLSLLAVNASLDICPTLEEEITTDYLIIWGWVAWLHAAQALIDKKCSVTLIEKSICGWGMSGRSWWFLTPDSELGLRQIEATYGNDAAKKIRTYGTAGQSSIVENIRQHNLHCDLRAQDSLLLWLGKNGKKAVLDEYTDRKTFWLDTDLIDNEQLKQHNSGQCYTAWLRYTDCFAINPMQYCQELKLQLLRQGVRIYEFSHIHKLEKHRAETNLWSIHFKQAIICPWKAESAIFPGYAHHTYGIHNYIAISEPLSKSQVVSMMPSGECMCRDTKLVFTYYRLTGDRRIVLWWGTPVSSFQPRDILSNGTISSVIHSFKHTFPALREVEFPHYRSGRIEASKDLMPLIWANPIFPNHIRVQGAVWLPRAAACGKFATQLLHHEADQELTNLFNYKRSFFIPFSPRATILKAMVFWLSNAKAMQMI